MPRTPFLLLTLVAGTALAQREPPDQPKAPADDGGPPRVYFVHSYNDDDQGWYSAGLGNRLSVHVQNFGKVLEKTGGSCSGVVLFIEGFPIRGLKPESCDQMSGHVRYQLRRTEQSNETWNDLLGKPHHHVKSVGISIGTNDQFSIESTVTEFELVVIPRAPLWVFAGISAALLALFTWLSVKTGMIRAHEYDEPVADRPYSLAMFQMVFWFYLVISAYVFIWLITGELDTITESVLALLGVGTATALGGSVIDTSAKKKETKAIVAISSNRTPPKSQGFLLDLLNEGDTISLSRFQLFLWTLTLGVIFCRSVYNSLHMPEFSATLLALMGISSGTYLGFKTQHSSQAGTALAPAAPEAAVQPVPAAAEDPAEPKR